jgi:sigma-B regulation protein RsbU (phosphoserine phosphatase)
MVCRASAGPIPITGLRMPMKKGIVGRVMETGESHIVKDVHDDPDFNPQVDRDTGFSTRSIMCTPLRIEDRTLGVMQVLNKKSGSGLFSDSDLDVLHVLGSFAALAINSAQMAADLMEQRRIKQELDLARQLQTRLLPAPQPAPFPLVGINLPHYEVSGDFYDYYPIDAHRIGFSIGDVSGKGINAALLMVRTTSLLRSLGRAGLPLSELLGRVNRELCETGSQGMFVCALVGVFDRRTGQVTLCNAGFPAPLLRKATGRFDALPADAPPLGIVPESSYSEEQVKLAGGALYLYSDGVTESRNARGKCIGVAGLARLVKRHAALPLRARLAAIVDSLRQLSLRDDTTLLILEVQPDKERLAEIEVRARPEEMRKVRAVVGEALATAGCPAELADQLILAVDEACTNAIRHSYKNDPKGRLIVTVDREGSTLVFRRRDFAPPVDPKTCKPRDPAEIRPGGLGIHFIDTIMDSWGFEPPADGAGNLFVMRKALG